MELNILMKSFAERLDMVPPESDDRGEYTLTFDEDFDVRFIPAGKDRLILQGSVCNVPEDEGDADEHLKKLLKINLARMKTQKEVLSLDKESREVILYRQVATDGLSAGDFEETLEGFVNTLEYWVKVAGAEPGGGPPPSSMIFP